MKEYLEQNIIKPEDLNFDLKMRAQYDIIQDAGGDVIAMEWIDANGERFDEILSDPETNFYKLLSNEGTYIQTLQKIKDKLYH